MQQDLTYKELCWREAVYYNTQTHLSVLNAVLALSFLGGGVGVKTHFFAGLEYTKLICYHLYSSTLNRLVSTFAAAAHHSPFISLRIVRQGK